MSYRKIKNTIEKVFSRTSIFKTFKDISFINEVTILSIRIDVFAVISTFWDTLMTSDKTKKSCGRKSFILKLSKKFQVDSSKKWRSYIMG